MPDGKGSADSPRTPKSMKRRPPPRADQGKPMTYTSSQKSHRDVSPASQIWESLRPGVAFATRQSHRDISTPESQTSGKTQVSRPNARPPHQSRSRTFVPQSLGHKESHRQPRFRPKNRVRLTNLTNLTQAPPPQTLVPPHQPPAIPPGRNPPVRTQSKQSWTAPNLINLRTQSRRGSRDLPNPTSRATPAFGESQTNSATGS